MHGCRNHIVARLPFVNVIIRVDRRTIADFSAQNFVGAVGDYFVGVHVCGCSGARLENIQHKLGIQLAFHHFFCSLHNCFGNFFIQPFQIQVGLGGAVFNHAQCPDKCPWKTIPADREIFDSPLCLCAPIRINRYLHFPHRIFLDPVALLRHNFHPPFGSVMLNVVK